MSHYRAAILAATLLIGLICLAPSALAVGADPQAGLGALACTSVEDCTAVTTYENAIGEGEGEMLTEHAGVWGPGREALMPKNAAANSMVTSYFFDYGLYSVQCAEPGDCAAIGDYITKDGSVSGFFLDEHGGHWQRGVAAKLPANATSSKRRAFAGLDAITCPAAGNCVATGQYTDQKADTDAVVFKQVNGIWQSGTELPLPAKASGSDDGSALYGLACPTATGCVAVGTYTDTGHAELPLIEHETAGHWTPYAPALPTNAAHSGFDFSYLDTVSCAASGDCVAGGNYSTKSYNQEVLLVAEKAGVWGPGTTLALPANHAADAFDQDAGIDSIDCPAVGDCSAVGDYRDTDRNSQGLLLSESAGTWAAAAGAPLPAPAAVGLFNQDASVAELSCVSAGNCVATGAYSQADASSTPGRLVEEETNGSWSGANQIALPVNAARDRESFGGDVSCFAGSTPGPAVGGADCDVVGGYVDARGDDRGFAASGSAGVFGRATEAKLPPVNHGELVNSLRSVLSPRGANATLGAIDDARGYRYGFKSAEAGTVSAVWHATIGGRRRVIARLKRRTNGPGTYKLTIKLTPEAVRALRELKTIEVTAAATFKAHTGAQAIRTTQFTLTRSTHKRV